MEAGGLAAGAEGVSCGGAGLDEGRGEALERTGDLASSDGTGERGGDMRCSGLGAGAGLEAGTTMCLGERGLSLRMTRGLPPTSRSTHPE